MTDISSDSLCCPSTPNETANRGCEALPAARAAIAEIRGEEVPADVAALRAAAFQQLLEEGRAVTASDLIAATDVTPDRVGEILEAARRRGRAEFDDEGRLIGVAGLSLTPSRHALVIDGKTRWTWCALDAVGILGALQATGTVRSSDPQTGESIEILFRAGRPTPDAHLFILGGFSQGNVRADWCPQVNFFTDREAAQQWVTANGLEGDIVTVAEVADEAAAMWSPVVDLEAPQTC